MATHNSARDRQRENLGRTLLGVALIAALWALAPLPGPAAEAPAARAERSFREARQRCRHDPEGAEAAWQFARACFDWAEFATNDAQRADLAQRGIDTCRQALERDANVGATHHYLALNLGQFARTKSVGALKLVNEMEVEFQRAIELHSDLDFAGPHRALGTLYRDAPGWPTSVGNRSKARLHLQKAVELSPDYPDNRLTLLESQLKWGERKSVLADVPAVEVVLADARKKFTGDEWAANWEEWDDRWLKIKKKASDEFKPLETPHAKK
jgi:tetratricopeptide (TPR) repeat protein